MSFHDFTSLKGGRSDGLEQGSRAIHSELLLLLSA
jgi:hypothetical protein